MLPEPALREDAHDRLHGNAVGGRGGPPGHEHAHTDPGAEGPAPCWHEARWSSWMRWSWGPVSDPPWWQVWHWTTFVHDGRTACGMEMPYTQRRTDFRAGDAFALAYAVLCAACVARAVRQGVRLRTAEVLATRTPAGTAGESAPDRT